MLLTVSILPPLVLCTSTFLDGSFLCLTSNATVANSPAPSRVTIQGPFFVMMLATSQQQASANSPGSDKLQDWPLCISPHPICMERMAPYTSAQQQNIPDDQVQQTKILEENADIEVATERGDELGVSPCENPSHEEARDEDNVESSATTEITVETPPAALHIVLNGTPNENKPSSRRSSSASTPSADSPNGLLKCSRRRVSFPDDDSKLVTCYLEPVNPIEAAQITNQELLTAYIQSCIKHGSKPLDKVVQQLETLDLSSNRSASLTLRGLNLDAANCESLEEIFRRVQLRLLDLSGTQLDDEGLGALFDMVEFYEAASHVSIALNAKMGPRGWQSCSRMIKRTQCLEWLDAAQISLSEHSSALLGRALRLEAPLKVLHLDGCSLAGRPLATLVGALKLNSRLKELHLADNQLGVADAVQLSILLRVNRNLQVLDLRNNYLQDAGLFHLCDSLTDQGCGLNALTLWNNKLTYLCGTSVGKALASNKSLSTLNLGYNALTSEGILLMKPGLLQNRTLLRLGLQATRLSCPGLIALAEALADGPVLQRLDLRANELKLAGLMALTLALKMSPHVTCVDLPANPGVDDKENAEQYTKLYLDIEGLCAKNKEEAVGHLQPLEPPTHVGIQNDQIVSRKISLTCETSPPPVLLEPTDLSPSLEEPETDNGRKKFRSPLPSPLASPSPSPLPSPSPSSPSKKRFSVTPVQDSTNLLQIKPSPLPLPLPSPSPRSRFTVVPVAAPVNQETQANLVISSPTKVTLGFEVIDDKPISSLSVDAVSVGDDKARSSAEEEEVKETDEPLSSCSEENKENEGDVFLDSQPCHDTTVEMEFATRPDAQHVTDVLRDSTNEPIVIKDLVNDLEKLLAEDDELVENAPPERADDLTIFASSGI